MIRALRPFIELAGLWLAITAALFAVALAASFFPMHVEQPTHYTKGAV